MSETDNTFSLVSWNILLERKRPDLIRPQQERLGAIAAKLASLDVDLDVVTLQEAEGQNGDEIAKLTDHATGSWHRHSRKDEHVGMFGSRVGEVESIDLGLNRKAVATNIDDVTVVGGHLRYGLRLGDIRVTQTHALLGYLEDRDKAVVAMDFNDLPLSKPRRMLRDAGFISAFRAVGDRYPGTMPPKKYHQLGNAERFPRLWPALPIDDIYVRGVSVLDVGKFAGESDHFGLYATIKNDT